MMLFRQQAKREFRELRAQPRLPAGIRVEVGWDERGKHRLEGGRCIDISENGARVEIGEMVPVRTAIHLRFLDDVNFQADGIVRHSTGKGSIGVEFTQMMFCGSLVPRKQPPLPIRLATPIVATSVFLIAVAWFSDILPKWRPSIDRSASSATFTPSPFFTLGSTGADVQAVQGPPTASTSSTWSYGSSRVYFRRDRVIGWFSSRIAPLKVGADRVDPRETGAKAISRGSTAADVLALEGPPEQLAENVWRYGDSEIYFRDGRVVGWKSSLERPLRISAP
ncbi:MAG TPA: PilZ domain-containing protein [Bryobacteraceae bacterium]|nr:PilZ domain-containing protein [Bryobacteraceae bacterium]